MRGVHQAYQQLFYSFRHFLNRQYTSSIVGAFIANDEVSIILNKDNDNFNRRIMKLCTLFAGVMSSACTQAFNEREELAGKLDIVAFDARPMILDSANEITEYIRTRYLISNRYAFWKVLRLADIPNVLMMK